MSTEGIQDAICNGLKDEVADMEEIGEGAEIHAADGIICGSTNPPWSKITRGARFSPADFAPTVACMDQFDMYLASAPSELAHPELPSKNVSTPWFNYLPADIQSDGG